MKSVGAAVPEIQLGLCRRGGTGAGAKRVIGAYYIFIKLFQYNKFLPRRQSKATQNHLTRTASSILLQ